MSNETETKKLNLYQKLVEVRKDALYVKKGQKGYNFTYASGADILGILRTKMDEMGLLLVPNMESFELLPLQNAKGSMNAMKIVISYTWINAENPEEKLVTQNTYYEDKMTGCQGVGSLLTYAERYFLYKFFQVATDKDSPEEFYKKHNLSAIIDEQEEEENEEVEQPIEKQPVPSADQSTNWMKIHRNDWLELADKFWDIIKKKNPTTTDQQRPELLPLYIRYCQWVHQTVDVVIRFEKLAEDPEKLLTCYRSWYDREGKRQQDDMIPLYHNRARKQETMKAG